MNNLTKVIIVLTLIVAVGIVIAFKDQNPPPEPVAPEDSQLASSPAESSVSEPVQAEPVEIAALPKLIDLGAGTCIPCKMMAPILEQLKTDFKTDFEVVFIDIRENPEQGNEYEIKLIPTQIFFDATGKELFRHEGFYSREDILAKWKEFGFDFAPDQV